MKPMTIFILAIAFVVAGVLVARDYLPKKETPNVTAAKHDVAQAKRHEAEVTARLKSADQELEHTHQLVVATDAPLRRDSLAYEFGRRHLDTTNVDSLKAQVRRADSVIVDQRSKIRALEADTASKAHVIISLRAVVAAKDEKYAALDRLNAGIAAQIPTTGQKVVHDAKVVGFTLSAVGLVIGAIALAGH